MSGEAWWAIALGALVLLMMAVCLFSPALAEAAIRWDRRRPASPWYRAPSAGDVDGDQLEDSVVDARGTAELLLSGMVERDVKLKS